MNTFYSKSSNLMVMCITVVRHMLERSRSSSLKYSMKFMCYIHEKEIRDYMLILKIVDSH